MAFHRSNKKGIDVIDDELLESIKIWTVRVTLVGIISLFVWAIWFFCTHDYITIKTDKTNSALTISNTNNESNTITSTGTYKGFIKSGTYNLTATQDESMVSKTVTVKSFTFATYALSIPTRVSPLPVTNYDLTYAYNTKNGFYFVDNTTKSLIRATGDNGIEVVNNEYSIDQLSWSPDGSVGYAVGMSIATSAQVLLVISGDTVSAQNLPTSTSGAIYIAAASDGVYIQQNQTLYKKSISSQEFTTTGEVPENAHLASVGGKNIAYIKTKDEKESVVIYNTADKKQITIDTVYNESPHYYTSIIWKRDGSSYIVLNSGIATVYRQSDHSVIEKLPEHNITAAIWQGNSILYSTQNTILKYSSDSQSAASITSLESGNTITDFHESFVDSDIYFGAISSNNYYVYKIASGSNTSDSAASILSGSNMHRLSETCYINYMRTSKLHLIISGADSEGSDCLGLVKDYLADIGIDINTITIQKLAPQTLTSLDV